MTSSNQQLKFTIDVRQNILEQFAEQLGIPIINNQAKLDHKIGKGSIQSYSFLGGVELYYFDCKVNVPLQINSSNPTGSEWLLLNINLSTNTETKTVNEQAISFQKHLPSGMLFYTPHTKVESINPPNSQFKIAIIRFPKSFFEQYLSNNLSNLQNTKNALIYEDLDAQSERFLLNALNIGNNRLKRHSALLGFLGIFVDKLSARTSEKQYHNLHPDDVKNLFLIATLLRNPLTPQIPNIEQLAKMAKMGTTKFKNCFKQVFGSPPFKYHQKIRMEYARHILENSGKSVGEISYELGYSHPSKFTVAYKKQFNQLPSNV